MAKSRKTTTRKGHLRKTKKRGRVSVRTHRMGYWAKAKKEFKAFPKEYWDAVTLKKQKKAYAEWKIMRQKKQDISDSQMYIGNPNWDFPAKCWFCKRKFKTKKDFDFHLPCNLAVGEDRQIADKKLPPKKGSSGLLEGVILGKLL